MFFTSLSRTTLAVCLFWTYIRITWHFSALRIIDIDIIDIFSAPRVWNSLPISIHESQSLPTFRRDLKTFHFQSAYPLQLPILSRISLSMYPDSSETLALYKSFTYLLTYLQTIHVDEDMTKQTWECVCQQSERNKPLIFIKNENRMIQFNKTLLLLL